MTRTLHTLTGKIDDVPERILKTKAGRYLIKVDDDAKELVEGMFKPGLAVDFKENNSILFKDDEAVTEDVAPVPDATEEGAEESDTDTENGNN